MLKKILLLAFTFTGLQALADTTTPPPPTCPVARLASANIRVYKVTWAQQSGIWTSNSAQVCSESAPINVYGDRSNCVSHIGDAVNCEVVLNGQTQNVSIYGEVYTYNGSPAKKYFWLSYYINKDNGIAGQSSAYTQDLSLKTIGVYTQTMRTNDPTGQDHSDSITVYADFNDSNAP